MVGMFLIASSEQGAFLPMAGNYRCKFFAGTAKRLVPSIVRLSVAASGDPRNSNGKKRLT